ncbi:unnamed protein product [Prorocentrum cordatum]|uniref:Uncharacterized protein n=1 Tax=Prorocentrum cordatum TaxID=2364126 RepID=A0ABN9V1I9_9DINO|nr:unnamed protein product [Polarella glacialis]
MHPRGAYMSGPSPRGLHVRRSTTNSSPLEPERRKRKRSCQGPCLWPDLTLERKSRTEGGGQSVRLDRSWAHRLRGCVRLSILTLSLWRSSGGGWTGLKGEEEEEEEEGGRERGREGGILVKVLRT